MGEIIITGIRWALAAVLIALCAASIAFVVVMGGQAVDLFTTLFEIFANQVPPALKVAIFAGLAAIFMPFGVKFALWVGSKFTG